jgi:hypothetical protein
VVKAWLAYAAAGAAVTVVGAALLTLLVPGGAVGAVWFAAGLAYALQLVAFAALIVVRGRNELFLVGWLGGLVLRFAALGLVAFWLARTPVFPRAAALLSLVAFVFVLLLLEPLFLKRGLQPR